MPKKVVISAPTEQNNSKREKERRRREPNRRTVKRRNKRLFGELADLRAAAPIKEPPPRSMEQMLDDLRNRAYALWRFAAAEVDRLHPDDFWVQKWDAHGNVLVEPHRWVQFEHAARVELEELGIKLIGLDLEERRVRLEEAHTEVVVRWFDSVLGRLNLSEAQLDALPAALLAAAPILEGRSERRGTEPLEEVTDATVVEDDDADEVDG
jgi:hypothetical protein